nr:hypothetical protein [Tanacetum cinerariifolium]
IGHGNDSEASSMWYWLLGL